MKKAIYFLTVSIILLASLSIHTNALQEVLGKLAISTPIGGSNSTQLGLLNDGNQTIMVGIRVEGDAAKYLTFPTNVTLEPNQLVYVNITATIPSDYNGTENITGTVYALQVGAPGQVQVNVQLKHSIIIQVYNGTTVIRDNQDDPTKSFSILNYLIILIVIIFVIALALLYNHKKKKVTKERLDEAKKGEDENEQKNDSDISSIDDNNNDS